jgi:hypothetical protein
MRPGLGNGWSRHRKEDAREHLGWLVFDVKVLQGAQAIAAIFKKPMLFIITWTSIQVTNQKHGLRENWISHQASGGP